MNNSLKNLFLKYQDFPSFLNHSPITSVHDLGFMGETLLNLAVNSQSKNRKSSRTAGIPISTPIPTAITLGTGTQPDQHGNKYSLKNAHKMEKLCI